MFGIKNYNPTFYGDENDFLMAKKQDMELVVGKSIEKIYWVWDSNNNEWFTDCPVLLQLEDCSVSIL